MMTWMLAVTALALPPASATWTPLSASPVRIDCTTAQGVPYCRSTGVVNAAQPAVVETFAQLDRHVASMHKISRIDRLEPDVLHVVMDYPFPLTDRDYVARFGRRTESDGTVVFPWSPVTHAKAPDDGSTVRLATMDGEWRFQAEGAGTRVTYVWQSDPGGNLPDVSAVHKQAGLFAIQDIAAACGARVTGP